MVAALPLYHPQLKAAMQMEVQVDSSVGCFSAPPTLHVVLVDFSVQRNINEAPPFPP